MATYKTAYVVTTNNDNVFLIKQTELSGTLIIDAFNLCPGSLSRVMREEFISLKGICIDLLALGVSRDVLLPVFISVLVMIGLDVYSIELKVE